MTFTILAPSAVTVRALILVLLVVVASCREPTPRTLVLATTTSVANSGLLDVVLEAFRRKRGVQVRAHHVGSGLALRMLETGGADITITHAPDAEAAFLTKHPTWRYRKLMFNEFVLVGALTDPAGVKGSPTAADAMRRIAQSTSTFLSRGDQSGTHEREEQLWRRARARPRDGRLVIAGAGMGATLRIASEIGAYTLTDRATLAQFTGTLRLAIVFEGGPLLVNTYAVTMDPSGPRANDAQMFLDWLSGGAGRQAIESFRIRGIRAFSVWPDGAADDTPQALPSTNPSG